MTDIHKEIIKARPALMKVLPVVFWQTVVFSALSIILSASIFLWRPTIYPLIAPNLFWMTLWGFLFLSTGLTLAYGIFGKRWEMLRGVMCVDLFYKLLWSIALLFRIRDGGTLLIAALFIGLSALQAVVIIFYLPPDEVDDGSAT